MKKKVEGGKAWSDEGEQLTKDIKNR